MTIAQDGTTWDYDHDPITIDGPPRLQIRPITVFGIRGVGHLVGELQEVSLRTRMTLHNFATEAALNTFLKGMNAQVGVLSGHITETLIDSTITHKNCTFMGAVPVAPAFYDASGQHGWVQRVTLLWISRNYFA